MTKKRRISHSRVKHQQRESVRELVRPALIAVLVIVILATIGTIFSKDDTKGVEAATTAKTIYVATSGKDTNSGTSSTNAVRTLGKAIALAKGSTTAQVLFYGGSYTFTTNDTVTIPNNMNIIIAGSPSRTVLMKSANTTIRNTEVMLSINGSIAPGKTWSIQNLNFSTVGLNVSAADSFQGLSSPGGGTLVITKNVFDYAALHRPGTSAKIVAAGRTVGKIYGNIFNVAWGGTIGASVSHSGTFGLSGIKDAGALSVYSNSFVFKNTLEKCEGLEVISLGNGGINVFNNTFTADKTNTNAQGITLWWPGSKVNISSNKFVGSLKNDIVLPSSGGTGSGSQDVILNSNTR